MDWFVNGLGFLALGLESTLPLPQLYRYAYTPQFEAEYGSTTGLQQQLQAENTPWFPSINTYWLGGGRFIQVGVGLDLVGCCH